MSIMHVRFRRTTTTRAMDTFKKCRGCKAVVYCGKACQKKDWKTHKKVCNKK